MVLPCNHKHILSRRSRPLRTALRSFQCITRSQRDLYMLQASNLQLRSSSTRRHLNSNSRSISRFPYKSLGKGIRTHRSIPTLAIHHIQAKVQAVLHYPRYPRGPFTLSLSNHILNTSNPLASIHSNILHPCTIILPPNKVRHHQIQQRRHRLCPVSSISTQCRWLPQRHRHCRQKQQRKLAP